MALTELAADVVLAVGGKDPRPRTAAIVVSAGNSTRMGGTVSKQFLEVSGTPVLARTLLAMEGCRYIDEIVVVARKEDLETVRAYCAAQVDTLWDEVKRFDNPHTYYVDLSQKLWDIKYGLLKNNAK